MSVRWGLLAILAAGPANGYQLRAEFERRTGGTWPLNIGQAYTTLQRLERDGLVEPVENAASDTFRLTPAGTAAVDAWWYSPVDRGAPARDELAIKLALAVTTPGVDVPMVVQHQRTQTLRSMRDLTALKQDPATTGPDQLAWRLVLDSLVFAAEAEIRWLDHVEATVLRNPPPAPATPTPAPAAETALEATASGRKTR